jgi:hypothetical protein
MVENLLAEENLYEQSAELIRANFRRTEFWQAILAGNKLKEFSERYQVDCHSQTALLDYSKPPVLQIKTFASLLDKTFRWNVIDNDDWDGPPHKSRPPAWILPSNWFSIINDTIRARFVVQHFDGVRFLVEKLVTLGNDSGIQARPHFPATPEGYYAGHVYLTRDFAVLRTPGTASHPVTIELQVTTQIQETILGFLHERYESRRSLPKSKDVWQWDYKSKEFRTNYLGHILHYLEGMIVDLRDQP